MGALLAGCGGEDETPLPDAVEQVLQQRCRRCHGDPTDNFAPMSMVTWEDMQRQAPSSDDPVYQAVGQRIVSADFPMPPLRSPEQDQITDADRQVLLDWIAAGAPARADGADEQE